MVSLGSAANHWHMCARCGNGACADVHNKEHLDSSEFSHVQNFMSSHQISVPPPPTIITQVDFARENATNKSSDISSEVSDQAEKNTPVSRHTPSQATYVALHKLPETPSEIPQVDTSTETSSSGASGLVPLIDQNPMNSPARSPSDPVSAISPLHREKHKLIESDPSDVPGLAPPVSHKRMDTPAVPFSSEVLTGEVISIQPQMIMPFQPATRAAYDISRPTCSMNLVCYRGGSGGCILRQVQTALESRFSSKEAFQTTIEKNPALISSDAVLFQELCRLYGDMSGFWRRYFSLKTLRGLRILAVR